MICPSCQAENPEFLNACGHCGATLVAPPTEVVVAVDLSPGAVFQGRYEVLSALGRGGMGMVYKARDRTLDEVVAIKVLRPDFGADPRMTDRFKSEIKLARKVRHKNVCTIHDYGEDRGLLYISMEFIDGTDLKKLLKRPGGLSTDRAYDIGIQVAEGLEAVHEAGIIHRDLKTANIMIDGRGVARLMDFGIAKREGDATLTATGQVVGTPEYMSPEQAQGKKVDFRSDVYALGVVLYETFTGRVPFRGDTPISTILKHLQDPPPLEGPQASRLPANLKPVLRRALAKDPDERFATVRALADALRHARAPSSRQVPQPTAMLEAPTVRRPRTASRSQAWLWAGLAAVVVGGVYLSLRTTPVSTVKDSSAPSSAAVLGTPTPPPPLPSEAPSPALPSEAPVAGRPQPAPAPVVALVKAPPRSAVPRPSPSTVTVATPPPETMPSSPSPPPKRENPSGPGMLQIAVQPWAEVTIDGQVVGTTPFDRISLAAGPHSVRLRHPAYEVLERRITIQPGQTEHLVVDLRTEGVRKP
jgi:serine/threonine protein kinase